MSTHPWDGIDDDGGVAVVKVSIGVAPGHHQVGTKFGAAVSSASLVEKRPPIVPQLPLRVVADHLGVVPALQVCLDLQVETDPNAEALLHVVLDLQVEADLQVWADLPVDASLQVAHDPHVEVDPLDGTKEFIEGVPHFSVSIALVENGYPVIGIIYNPYTKEMFSWRIKDPNVHIFT